MSPVFDLLASLAAIAAIFVGFGTLVVLSEDSNAPVAELHMVRSVVAIGLLTLVLALIPLALWDFGLSDRWLRRISDGLFLTLIWFGLLLPQIARTSPR
jgi:hypothetical protein